MAHSFHKPVGPRAEYQEKQRQRVLKSTSLADEFPQLKALTARLEYYDSDNPEKRSQLKYTVNLTNAKSVFRFRCPSSECIRGDFDLTKEVAEAVAKHSTKVTGEMKCKGNTVRKGRCGNTLHYTLLLGY
jgi:hypothetical protein